MDSRKGDNLQVQQELFRRCRREKRAMFMKEPMIPSTNIDDCTYRMIFCWPSANEAANDKDMNSEMY